MSFPAAIAAIAIASIPVSQPVPAEKTVRIALLSDTHTSLATTGEEAQYKARFDRVIAEVNKANVVLVLIAGDLTQSGKPDQIAAFAVQVKGLNAPVKMVFGNHDVGAKKGITGAKPGDGVTSERVTWLESALGPSFFAETIAGVRVVGINGSLLGSGFGEETRQWSLLERELVPSSSPSAPVLILSHYPLYLTSPEEPGGPYWNIEPAPRARLLSLIERSGKVRAMLSGHLHRSLSGRTPSGVFLYTTPPVSFGLPRGAQSEGWTLVTLTLPSGAVQAEFRPFPVPATDAPTEPPRSKL